jgi:hypothetical protein
MPWRVRGHAHGAVRPLVLPGGRPTPRGASPRRRPASGRCSLDAPRPGRGPRPPSTRAGGQPQDLDIPAGAIAVTASSQWPGTASSRSVMNTARWPRRTTATASTSPGVSSWTWTRRTLEPLTGGPPVRWTRSATASHRLGWQMRSSWLAERSPASTSQMAKARARAGRAGRAGLGGHRRGPVFAR